LTRVRIALIPPFGLVNKYLHNEPHQHYLFLAPYLNGMGNIRYKNHVKQACTRGTGYTILDNGAFEGEEVDPYVVDQIGREYGVDEIVVPDVMYDSQSTFELAKAYTAGDRKNYMGVVQGKSYDECQELVVKYANETKCEYITVLGLPKHLLKTCNDPYVRIRLTRFIRDNYPSRYQVHFLGQSPLFVKEVQEAQHFRVRSMDTSMPFVYAFYGINMSGNKVDDRERPENYFRLMARQFDSTLVDYNVHTLMTWAGGTR
jgi:hypothetical protein